MATSLSSSGCDKQAGTWHKKAFEALRKVADSLLFRLISRATTDKGERLGKYGFVDLIFRPEVVYDACPRDEQAVSDLLTEAASKSPLLLIELEDVHTHPSRKKLRKHLAGEIAKMLKARPTVLVILSGPLSEREKEVVLREAARMAKCPLEDVKGVVCFSELSEQELDEFLAKSEVIRERKEKLMRIVKVIENLCGLLRCPCVRHLLGKGDYLTVSWEEVMALKEVLTLLGLEATVKRALISTIRLITPSQERARGLLTLGYCLSCPGQASDLLTCLGKLKDSVQRCPHPAELMSWDGRPLEEFMKAYGLRPHEVLSLICLGLMRIYVEEGRAKVGLNRHVLKEVEMLIRRRRASVALPSS